MQPVIIEFHRKKNCLIILCILFLAPISVFSQISRTTDSLKYRISQTKDPKIKAQNYLQLSELLSRREMVAAKSYLDSASKFGKEKMTDSFLMLLNKGYADYYDTTGKPDSVIKYAIVSFDLAKKLRNGQVKAAALNLKGNAYMTKRNFKDAEATYLDAMRIYTSLNNDLAVGNLYVNLGYLFQQQHLVKEAEKQYGEAGIIFKKLANTDRLAQLYNN